MKVLVVDDAQFIRLRLAKLLTEHAYDVIEAADGEQAVASYRHARPDLVLMDITMPNKDGLQALEEILAVDPHARVIMLTALGQQLLVMQALRTGARDFLTKPFDPEKVLHALRVAAEITV